MASNPAQRNVNGHSVQSSSSAATLNDSYPPTNVLVTGLRRSGKTSMLQVIFHHCLPKDTFFLDPTSKVQKICTDSAIPLEFWDCPGNLPLTSLPLHQFSTLMFVVDIQDNFNYSIPQLVETVVAACRENPDINVEVFVHKADVLADDYKIGSCCLFLCGSSYGMERLHTFCSPLETYRHVQQRVFDELQDTGLEIEMLQLQFHLTSIYDHSIYESFSQVVQRLIDPLPYLEDLMNVFCANSRLSKAFLFDTHSRIYVATDASPVDGATHNLCCDYVHLISQFIPLYRDQAQSDSNDPSRWSSSSVRLNPDTTLAYWQITSTLAMVVLLPSETYDSRRGLVEYNLVFFKEGVQEILQVEAERCRQLAAPVLAS
ncbi:Gtr1/RagA G protein conserved region-domain-containing protein [Gautieria morchelliformis]|nr:Gtr1/RagA G protein conserved region-domain-containing protein [Gautieria morchelliformis]